MTVPSTTQPVGKEDEGLTHCNDILINLSLGKMNCEQHKETSLYKSILLQNLLNRRLVEKVEGIATCHQRRQEMRFILWKRRNSGTCENAPWSSNASGLKEEEDENTNMETDPPVTHHETQRRQARLRIRLVLKGNHTKNNESPIKSPKRPREMSAGMDEDLSGIKRRCGERVFSESPQPTLIL